MTNWRSSTAAAITALASFVLFSPQWFHPAIIDVAKFIFAGGLTAFGILVKDAAVHSTEGQVKVATAEKARDLIDSGKP